MSQRKDIKKLDALERSSARSIQEKIYARKVNSREGFRRRLVLPEWKCRIENNDFKRTNDMPSRLKKSSKNQMKIIPFEIENDSGDLTVGKVPFTKSVCKDRNILEDNFDSNGELPIEKVLRLHEFNGHEGIEREFDEHVFSLDKSLEQS
ncbi:hypothetical protein HS088_TW09G00786 [Tripterygium wilfordii]|uniref:Uncharacterized protein n=1 Tax=Tripterygium wilfordii TaxID=458696 RepID=A0A7J7D8V9_TRIWF|nr:hypothetical protein HS088_TW09G00786 [Tripterygium wilfordii]